MDVYIRYYQEQFAYAQFTDGKHYSTPLQMENVEEGCCGVEGRVSFNVHFHQDTWWVTAHECDSDLGRDSVESVRNTMDRYLEIDFLLTNNPAVGIEFESPEMERVRFRSGGQCTPYQRIYPYASMPLDPEATRGTFNINGYYVGRIVTWLKDQEDRYFVTDVMEYQNRPTSPASIMNTWEDGIIAFPS